MIRDFVKLGVLCVAMATGVAACSGGDDDDDGSSGNPDEIGAGSTVAGPFSGNVFSGTIEATVAAAVSDAFAPIGFTGIMTLSNGSSLNMTGTIDDATHDITLAGTNSSGTFTFVGSSAGGRITGTWTGPADAGTFSLLNTTSADATAFCGAFAITGENPSNGSIDLVVTDDFVAGVAVSNDGGGGYLEGTRSGNDIQGEVFEDGLVTVTFQGTINGTGASGNLYGPDGEDPPEGVTATWQVGPCE